MLRCIQGPPRRDPYDMRPLRDGDPVDLAREVGIWPDCPMSHPRKCRVLTGRYVGPLMHDTLDSLAAGPMTAREVAEDVGREIRCARYALRRSREQGLVVRIREARPLSGGRWEAGLYELTTEGRAWLEWASGAGLSPGVQQLAVRRSERAGMICVALPLGKGGALPRAVGLCSWGARTESPTALTLSGACASLGSRTVSTWGPPEDEPPAGFRGANAL